MLPQTRTRAQTRSQTRRLLVSAPVSSTEQDAVTATTTTTTTTTAAASRGSKKRAASSMADGAGKETRSRARARQGAAAEEEEDDDTEHIVTRASKRAKTQRNANDKTAISKPKAAPARAPGASKKNTAAKGSVEKPAPAVVKKIPKPKPKAQPKPKPEPKPKAAAVATSRRKRSRPTEEEEEEDEQEEKEKKGGKKARAPRSKSSAGSNKRRKVAAAAEAIGKQENGASLAKGRPRSKKTRGKVLAEVQEQASARQAGDDDMGQRSRGGIGDRPGQLAKEEDTLETETIRDQQTHQKQPEQQKQQQQQQKQHDKGKARDAATQKSSPSTSPSSASSTASKLMRSAADTELQEAIYLSLQHSQYQRPPPLKNLSPQGTAQGASDGQQPDIIPATAPAPASSQTKPASLPARATSTTSSSRMAAPSSTTGQVGLRDLVHDLQSRSSTAVEAFRRLREFDGSAVLYPGRVRDALLDLPFASPDSTLSKAERRAYAHATFAVYSETYPRDAVTAVQGTACCAKWLGWWQKTLWFMDRARENKEPVLRNGVAVLG
ncbi:hypothetical protein AAL_01695 [Moelleriella libera RCEF 2490]|uniref:Uncharacterized protein n=1 Tax=Moelleriella libera RCEF 2490 TaxID=1081109 RepID=A0A166UD63_9HYPO|nr:hypothetical protein AAL_01695 [Moelleriella libera RCEF 2490]